MQEKHELKANEAGTVAQDQQLSARHREALNRFILFWGEMASNWGINRTMAQIHALLYAAEEPLDTDQIMAQLQISRGNANMNLRSLINWNLVRKVHHPGSRKDFYTAEKDVWQITAQIIKERERREIKPVKQQLQECQEILKEGDKDGALAICAREQLFYERIENLIGLMDVFEGFSKALRPFIQEQREPVIKQFIQFAEALSEPLRDRSD